MKPLTLLITSFILINSLMAKPPGCDYSPPEYSRDDLLLLSQYRNCVLKKNDPKAAIWKGTEAEKELRMLESKPENSKPVRCITVEYTYNSQKYCYSVTNLALSCMHRSNFQPFPQSKKFSCPELKERYAPDFDRLVSLVDKLKESREADAKLKLKHDLDCQKQHPEGAKLLHGPCRKMSGKRWQKSPH